MKGYHFILSVHDIRITRGFPERGPILWSAVMPIGTTLSECLDWKTRGVDDRTRIRSVYVAWVDENGVFNPDNLKEI